MDDWFWLIVAGCLLGGLIGGFLFGLACADDL